MDDRIIDSKTSNRRRFFSNLFQGIVAAGIAPSIIVPCLTDRQIWKPNVVVPCRKLKAMWTVEAEQELQAFYAIILTDNMTREIA